MATTTLPTTTTQQHVDHRDAIEELALDALSGMADKEECEAKAAMLGEGGDVAAALGFDEAKSAKKAANCFAALDAVQSRKRVYRTLALNCPALPPMPCRVLCRLLEYADADLDNSFPLLATVAKVMGVSERVIKRNVRQLIKRGWISRCHFRGEFTGNPCSSGTQFLIPPGVVDPLSTGWKGPDGFDNRLLQTRVRTRVRRKRRIYHEF